MILAVGLVGLGGCTHVDGWMEGRDVAGHAWRMTPDRCYSGRRLLFEGVEIESSGPEPHSASVAVDPVKGNRVIVVNSATHERVVFDASQCVQFQTHVRESSERWFGRHPVSGSIALACGDANHSLRAAIAFDFCH